MASSSNSGCGTFLLIGAVLWVIAAIPKPIWITIGALAATALVIWIAKKISEQVAKNRAAAREQARAEEAAARLRRKQRLIASVGPANAAVVEQTAAAAKQIASTEAARAGWLGEIDFRPDITMIINQFQKAFDLRKVADQLSALADPGPDDHKILTEATTTIAALERAATERVGLIARCASEAQGVDNSLRKEREDARTAEQRAELHAKLSTMLYGIEASPAATPTSSAADSVLARVQAYREIKNQIQLIRDSDPAA